MGDPWTISLDQLDVADPQLFQDDGRYWFARLRRDDPVHFHSESRFGPFWSVTKYADIITVEATPSVFSSASGITLADQEAEYRLPMFIAMDPPKHKKKQNHDGLVIVMASPRGPRAARPEDKLREAIPTLATPRRRDRHGA